MSKKKKSQIEKNIDIEIESKKELSDEEILARAEKIKASQKKPVDDMPIRSPEQAKSYLEECGYVNIPVANP